MRRIEEALEEYKLQPADNTITSSDITTFFKKSEDRVRSALNDKEARMLWIKSKLESLRNRPHADTKKNGIQEKLDNLLFEHENAYAEFVHKKEYKQACLLRRLKLSLIRDDKIGTIECLFDIDLLRSATKDNRVSELLNSIAHYTEIMQNDSEYKEYYDVALYINELVEEQAKLALECDAIRIVLDAQEPN